MFTKVSRRYQVETSKNNYKAVHNDNIIPISLVTFAHPTVAHTHTHTHIYIYIYRERERECVRFSSWSRILKIRALVKIT